MTIKNRKDRSKTDHSDRDCAGPSSRHSHSYRPYAYPDERKENGLRSRGRIAHASEGVCKGTDLSYSEVLSKPYECRLPIREPVSNSPITTVDKEHENNSEDEYHGTNPAYLNCSETDETNLEKLLMEKRGWKVIKVMADGACLFRSVAHQVFGDEEKHELVRKQVVDYMLKNREHFSPYVTEDFDRYICRKRDPTCYGNHVEIQAIAELYNRPVEIYHDSVNPINVFHADYSKEFPIRLSYHGHVHYNSVVDPFKPSFGHGLGMPNYQPNLTESDLIAQAIHESEVTQLEETMLHDKISESEQLDIDRCIEAEVVRESYFDYLNQLKTRRGVGSPNSQPTIGNVTTVARTPSPPMAPPGGVASSSNATRYTSLRPAHPRSPVAVPSCSQQPYPTGMDEDSIIAMVLERSRVEYLESLKKRSSMQHEVNEPQESPTTEPATSATEGRSGQSPRQQQTP